MSIILQVLITVNRNFVKTSSESPEYGNFKEFVQGFRHWYYVTDVKTNRCTL
jgi:hypothetical protein